MSEEKKMMSVDEMEDAAGGKNHGYGFGFYMTPCYYRYVCFNGIWGWANASFLA